jgi:hypothetical protein
MEPSDDLYIIVPKWEKFQHYKDRDPVWIKVYTKLLHDPAYMQLSLASRGLLTMVWLHYAASSLVLRCRDVRALVGHNRGIGLQLLSLRDAGFIELSASRLLATKKETEEELPTTLVVGSSSSNAGLRRCSVCGQPLPRNVSREDHMRIRHGIDPVEA